MSLTSLPFFLAFAASLAVYYLIPKRLQWTALLLFSLGFFVLSSTPYTLIYLAASIVSTTVCAGQIGRGKAENNGRKAKTALILAIIVNAGLLAALKYNGFFINNVNRIFSLVHAPVELPAPDLAAPIGISYYTFTVIGYLLDTYWGIAEPQPGLLKTALFVGYYPQLTSGPITRYGDMGGQLYGGHRFDYTAVTFGLQRMLWGVFKKLVISARLGVMVDTIYGDPAAYPGLYIWLAAALFMFQLYTDFSGCMDIVMGASECYGIVLPENFRTPFFSRSMQEFWQRWHITLGAWMRDYVLYPILRAGAWRRMTKWLRAHWGKSAAKQIPSCLGMLCVWMLNGLWHGGSWKYICGLGLWIWAMIVLGQVFEPVFKKMIRVLRINTECFSWHLFQSVRVFVLMCIGIMFFRLDGLTATMRVMRTGLHWNPWIFADGSLFQLGLDRPDFWVTVFSLGVLLLVSVLEERGKSVRRQLAEQNLVFRWAVLLALIFGILVLGMYGPGYDAQSFIYGQF